MCGIVGLLVKTPSMRDQLGEMMLPMLVGMSERGPESAGLAVFTAPVAEDRRKFSVYAGAVAPQWDPLRADPRFQQCLVRMGLDAAERHAHARSLPPRVRRRDAPRARLGADRRAAVDEP